ncbi:MAG: hypothetical protein J0L61_05945 [Planctomycetes bacterium]|nr:hypothetical protein [Planctomycetota bacterium]
MKRRVRELVVILRADPKRAGVLGVLAVVLTVVSVRAMIAGGPSRASAASKDGTARTTAEALAAGAGVAAALEKRTGRIVTAPTPPAELRDVFRLDAAAFPQPSQVKAETSQVAEKSGVAVAENPEEAALRERAALEARVAKEASLLRLRGTLLGSNPTAVIETPADRRSVVVTPGQEVLGFTLIEVKASGVVLEKEGVRVEIARDVSLGE